MDLLGLMEPRRSELPLVLNAEDLRDEICFRSVEVPHGLDRQRRSAGDVDRGDREEHVTAVVRRGDVIGAADGGVASRTGDARGPHVSGDSTNRD